MTDTFPCTACGAPNEAEAGQTSMACTYCGTTLSIPASLRTKAMPKVEKIPSKAKPVVRLEEEAPDLLRKAQPVAVQAWNLFAYWTWLRRLIPACLTIFILGFFVCMAVAALPFVLNWFR